MANVNYRTRERPKMPYSYGDPSKHSKSAVRRAGDNVALRGGTPEDKEIVRNWRNSHAFVLTTFQNTLRRYIKTEDRFNVVFAQRLKRLNTILDKLSSGRARDLSTMHDLAGCRLIFDDIDHLRQFRARFHQTRAKHKRVDNDKFDYLASPKRTGYRGIHDVFQYNVPEGSSGSVYNGLKVEIQYRTKAQHAWATAVEISDLLDGARIKFDEGANPKRERLFVLASEFIARDREGMNGCASQLSDADLRREMRELEDELNVIRTLDAARRSQIDIPQQKHVVLRFHDGELVATGFTNPKDAISFRDSMEGANPEDDIVYVSASSPRAVADAFRNYFRDAVDFVEMIRPALIA
ncbi:MULTISPECIES: RelA/SpoT domain-containing protein [Achromobacter]|jgi:putative GTP pyrophosphokinase|nr:MULTISPECIES: RelA/SpoT domain-containing protein [Achromobacter]